jgi:hypothetical protein
MTTHTETYDEAQGVYCPSEQDIEDEYKLIREANEKAMKAGRGNHTKRRQGNIRTTTAASRRERGME